jgi:hypothetical protein
VAVQRALRHEHPIVGAGEDAGGAEDAPPHRAVSHPNEPVTVHDEW